MVGSIDYLCVKLILSTSVLLFRLVVSALPAENPSERALRLKESLAGFTSWKPLAGIHTLILSTSTRRQLPLDPYVLRKESSETY
jgi:hypothetical protein